MRDPRVEPKSGDILRLRYYDFDECDVEIIIEWSPRFPDFIVGLDCPIKTPSYFPSGQKAIARVELWAFREWAKDATVIHRAEEASNG